MRLLIIVYGLMRTYKITWPILERQLDLETIERGGGVVDVVVTTSLTQRCSPKDIDFMNNPCPSYQTPQK